MTFTPPASGASATITDNPATTDASGIASVTATANAIVGGPYTVTAAASGVSGPAFTLTNVAPTITLNPTTLPIGTKGQLYPNQTITASGRFGPYTFAATGGALPSGLTLTAAGVLGGTPTVSGDFTFTITATDTNGSTGSQAYTLTIAPSPLTTITISCPSGVPGTLKVGEMLQCTATGTFADGSHQTLAGVQWASSNGSIVAIDSGGKATGMSPGSVTITASSGATGTSVGKQAVIQGSLTLTVGSGTSIGVAPAPAPANRPGSEGRHPHRPHRTRHPLPGAVDNARTSSPHRYTVPPAHTDRYGYASAMLSLTREESSGHGRELRGGTIRTHS